MRSPEMWRIARKTAHNPTSVHPYKYISRAKYRKAPRIDIDVSSLQRLSPGDRVGSEGMIM